MIAQNKVETTVPLAALAAFLEIKRRNAWPRPLPQTPAGEAATQKIIGQGPWAGWTGRVNVVIV
jgi:hypothetical protein